MQVPIPDDWSGENWHCIQLQWPDSPQWTAVLLGLLTYPTRGRFWSADSGVIKDVQQIGQQIYNANFPFTDCSGETIENGKDDSEFQSYVYAICGAIESEDYMSLCGYNPKAFDIVDGVFLVRDFCGEWVPIGNVGTAADQPPVVIPPDIDTNETGIYPCGKAEHLASELIRFVDEAWDESDNTLPLAFIWQMQNFMGYDLKNFWTDQVQSACMIAKGVLVAGAGLVTVSKSEVLPDGLLEELTCRILPAMSDTAVDDKSLIYSTLRTALDAIFPPFALPDGPFIHSIWDYARQAFGEQLCHDIAQAGAYTDAECACEGGTVIIPPSYSNIVIWDGTQTVTLASQGCSVSLHERTTIAQTRVNIIAGANANFQELHHRLGLDATGTVSELEFTLRDYTIPNAVMDYFPAAVWSDTTPTPQANYVHPTLGNVTAPDSTQYLTSEHVLKAIFTWNTPVDLSGAYMEFGIKVNPKDNTSTQQIYRNYYELTYAGALR